MVKISDPIFIQAIENLKENKPRNYSLREIDLHNDDKDVVQRETIVTGNILIVLNLPKDHEVYIQFNEKTNTSILLKEGIILFNFYRFFLSFKHLVHYREHDDANYLKLLIGKDLIYVPSPTPIKQGSKVIVDDDWEEVPEGGAEGSFYTLKFQQSQPDGRITIPKGYNQLRGIIMSEATTTRKFRIQQFSEENIVYTEFDVAPEIPDPDRNEQPFIIDLVADRVAFQIYQGAGESAFEVVIFAEAWSV